MTPLSVLFLVLGVVVCLCGVMMWLVNALMTQRQATVETLSGVIDGLANMLREFVAVDEDPAPRQDLAAVQQAISNLAGVASAQRGMPTRVERPEMYVDPYEHDLSADYSEPLAPSGGSGWVG